LAIPKRFFRALWFHFQILTDPTITTMRSPLSWKDDFPSLTLLLSFKSQQIKRTLQTIRKVSNY
jgi:hypothetical protein